MPCETRPALDLWSLMRVYTVTFDILVEANLQLPRAVMREWSRMVHV